MKLLSLVLAFMAVVLVAVSGMSAGLKSAGLRESKEHAGCSGGRGGGGPPPPPPPAPTNSTG